MATSTVPCSPAGSARFTQVTSLDGRDFQLAFAWSQRRGAWTLDVADVNGAAIRAGAALVTEYPLVRAATDARWTGGELLLLDTTGADGDPGFDDLGTRFELVYYDAADWAAILGGS